MATLDRAHKGRSRRRGANPARWRYPYGGAGRYTPKPKQEIAHRTWAFERFFGGAAGPGKTDWIIGEAVRTCLAWGVSGALFRRHYVDLQRASGIIARLLDRIPPHVGRYTASPTPVWHFANGARLDLGALEKEGDVLKFHGAEYGFIGFDELTQFTEWQYRYMVNRLRVDVEVYERGFRPFLLTTGNPGGPGHAWVKARFVDPAPPFVVWQPDPTEDEPKPGTRVFIMATLDDNDSVDPGYAERLENLPEDDRRALRWGDWDVYAGQRFRDFRRDVHVIDPEDLPLPLGGITRAQGIDYGLDAPFCCLWGAKLADDLVVVYRELYEAGLTAVEQAQAILEAERAGERRTGRPLPAFVDPSTFIRAHPRSPISDEKLDPPRDTIARDYVDAGLQVVRGANNRLVGVATVANALRVRGEPGRRRPGIYIYSTCRNLIRTLPMLQRSKTNPEDVDTHGEDHAYDALRYLLLGLGNLPSQRETTPPAPRRGPPRAPSGEPRTLTGDLSRASW